MYYNGLLVANRNKTKETWKILNQVIKKNRSSENIENLKFKEGSKTYSSEKAIANGFNNFFVSIGPNLADNITSHSKNSCDIYLKEKNINSMFLTGVVEHDIIKTVNNFNNKVSLDCRDLNMKLVKSIIHYIVEPFTYICNKSFEDGIFPEEMKLAKVLPLFKSGPRDQFTNYRPVSLLSQFSKILETLYADKLDKFISTFKILNNSQYGFRSNCSTSMALMELLEEITNSIDNKKSTIGVFIDLKKAFDTINHGILIKKLEHYGIRGTSNSWIKSYLTDRHQYVCFNGLKSDLLKVKCGVPQGSILGPKLFLLYINDLCNISEKLKFILFADDTNIFYSDSNIGNIASTLNLELEKLNSWFATNKLSLNISKTNFMLFTKCKNIPSFNVVIQQRSINRVSVNKFLGILIDDKLTWKDHITYISSKIVKNISVLNKVKYIFDCQSLKLVYCSLILPYLMYCVEIWGNSYKSNLVILEKLQKRVIRIISGANYYDHTSKLFYNLKLLKFLDLVKCKTLLVMFKAYNMMLPINLQVMFLVVKDINYSTRQINKFKVKYVRTHIKSMATSVTGVKLWNSLGQESQRFYSIHAFTNYVKKSFFEKY